MIKHLSLSLITVLAFSSLATANINKKSADNQYLLDETETDYLISQNHEGATEIEVELPVLQEEPTNSITASKPEIYASNSSSFFLQDGNEQKPVIDTGTLLKNLSKGLHMPSIWPVDGIITSNYGVLRGGRKIAVRGNKRYRLLYTRHHKGIDIAAPTGSPIVAPSDAVVAFVGIKGGYGKCVILDHGQGVTSLYGHNSEILVSEGEKVKRGEIISRVGSTGHSTGPHLHFEIRKDDEQLNPMSYIRDTPIASKDRVYKQAQLD